MILRFRARRQGRSTPLPSFDPRRNDLPYGHLHHLAASTAGATGSFDGLPHMFGHRTTGNMGSGSIEIREPPLPRFTWEMEAEPDFGGAGKRCDPRRSGRRMTSGLCSVSSKP